MELEYSKEAFLSGQLLLIDKPLEWTSFQLVNKIRWAIRKTYGIKKIKVGHAGTLDPLATGLMLICTGRMTKEIEKFMGMEKIYTGSFRLGATTPSFDLETEPTNKKEVRDYTMEELEQICTSLSGDLMQAPPIYSAIKKEGKRLYTIARAGKTIDVPKRKVHVNEFIVTERRLPDVSFKISCSKGTYIRSLAHDYGQALGCGAYLAQLKRTAIGAYKLSESLSLDEFLNALERG
jgi:tRNA pseudouridine55 synthase